MPRCEVIRFFYYYFKAYSTNNLKQLKELKICFFPLAATTKEQLKIRWIKIVYQRSSLHRREVHMGLKFELFMCWQDFRLPPCFLEYCILKHLLSICESKFSRDCQHKNQYYLFRGNKKDPRRIFFFFFFFQNDLIAWYKTLM